MGKKREPPRKEVPGGPEMGMNATLGCSIESYHKRIPMSSLDKPKKEGYAETMARNGNRNGKRKNGRPAKLNAAITKKVCNVIREGNFIDTAAGVSGVSDTTLDNWMKWGNPKHTDFKRDGEYQNFFAAVKNAEREGEVKKLEELFLAKGMAWTRYAWFLERRFPAKWGRRFQQLPQSQQDDGVKGIEETQEAMRKAQGDPAAEQGAMAMQKFLRMNGETARPN